jgi:hypothetical protein
MTRHDNANIRPCLMGEDVVFAAAAINPALAQQPHNNLGSIRHHMRKYMRMIARYQGRATGPLGVVLDRIAEEEKIT